jgi:hypothetical protein
MVIAKFRGKTQSQNSKPRAPPFRPPGDGPQDHTYGSVFLFRLDVDRQPPRGANTFQIAPVCNPVASKGPVQTGSAASTTLESGLPRVRPGRTLSGCCHFVRGVHYTYLGTVLGMGSMNNQSIMDQTRPDQTRDALPSHIAPLCTSDKCGSCAAR